MREESDQLLFEKVQSRDPRAFDELVRRHAPALFSFIIRLVSNSEDAQDLLQDTWVRVWERSRQFQSRSTVKTWIYRIALNLSYSHLNRRKRWSYSILEEVRSLVSGSDPVQDTELKFQSELLEKSLVELTPRQRSVVVARIYEDLPYAEISASLGCSVNAAKVHFHDGKQRIESFMKAQAGEHG